MSRREFFATDVFHHHDGKFHVRLLSTIANMAPMYNTVAASTGSPLISNGTGSQRGAVITRNCMKGFQQSFYQYRYSRLWQGGFIRDLNAAPAWGENQYCSRSHCWKLVCSMGLPLKRLMYHISASAPWCMTSPSLTIGTAWFFLGWYQYCSVCSKWLRI